MNLGRIFGSRATTTQADVEKKVEPHVSNIEYLKTAEFADIKMNYIPVGSLPRGKHTHVKVEGIPNDKIVNTVLNLLEPTEARQNPKLDGFINKVIDPDMHLGIVGMALVGGVVISVGANSKTSLLRFDLRLTSKDCHKKDEISADVMKQAILFAQKNNLPFDKDNIVIRIDKDKSIPSWSTELIDDDYKEAFDKLYRRNTLFASVGIYQRGQCPDSAFEDGQGLRAQTQKDPATLDRLFVIAGMELEKFFDEIPLHILSQEGRAKISTELKRRLEEQKRQATSNKISLSQVAAN